VTFRASVEGGEPNTKRTFNWTVSTGKIISGQGTPAIKVATPGASSGADYEGITATVEVGNLTASCSATASYAVQIKVFCPDRKFDEFGDLSFDEEKARLESFISRLQGDPDALGLMKAYAGKCARVGEAEARLERMRDYLVNLRGLDRIVTKNEGCQEEDQAEVRIELWVMPTKAPALPTPAINLKEAQNDPAPEGKPAAP
jgi:TolA-binding protein